MSTASDTILVGIELAGHIYTAGALTLKRSVSNGVDRSVGQFRYAKGYLNNPLATPVDPVHLPLQDKSTTFSSFGGLPPALRDCAPDAWGRSLIRQYALSRGITGDLSEADYLLASPADRISNLHFATRFTSSGEPAWNHLAITPPALPALEHLHAYVARAIRLAAQADKQAKEAIAARQSPCPMPEQIMALITGAGGARPKVHVRARDGLWMVKLPNIESDPSSMPRIESASMDLARICGIDAARTRAERAGGQDLLLVKRFDFDEEGRRRQMISAMTVLSASEDPYQRINWSYPKLAIALNDWSAQPAVDKLALFRCMVLRALLSDRDDHPRNYALIRIGADPGQGLGQWRLSPMFDCVIGLGRGLNAETLLMDIGERGGEISRANMLSQCHTFGLTREQAEHEIGVLEGTVLARWEEICISNGVSRADRELARASITPIDARRIETFKDRLERRFRQAEAG